MFTICDLQLEPGRFHYTTDLKFLSHACNNLILYQPWFILCGVKLYYNTTSAVYARLSVNRDMVKYFEALGLLTTPVMFMLYQPTSQLLH